MADRAPGEVTNFRGIGTASRSTEPSYHTETKLGVGRDPTGAVANGSKTQNVMPKSSENKRRQQNGDYDS